MRNKLFGDLDFLMDSTKAHDCPTLFSFVKNEIESILDNLDDVECYRDIELVLDGWHFDSVIYKKDSSSIFLEKYRTGDDFDNFLFELGYSIDGNFANGTNFDNVALIFANYTIEREVRDFFSFFAKEQTKTLHQKCIEARGEYRSLLGRINRLKKLQGGNITEEYNSLLWHLGGVFKILAMDDGSLSCLDALALHKKQAKVTKESQELLEILCS